MAELAAFVDEKMRLAAQECPAGDTLKIAVLAALNIADECFRALDAITAGRASLDDPGGPMELERMVDLAIGLADPQIARAPKSSRRPPRPEVRSLTGVLSSLLCS